MLVIAGAAYSQTAPEWMKSYSHPGEDTPGQIRTDLAGNIYVAATSNEDFLLIKYSPAGDTLWTRTFNGAGNTTETLSHMITDHQFSGIYLIGESKLQNGDIKTSVVKYDTAGVRKWASILSNGSYAKTLPQSSVITWSGRIFTATISYMGANNDQILSVAKIDTSNGSSVFGSSRNYGQDIFKVNSIGTDFGKILMLATERAGNFGIIRYDTTGAYLGERNFDFGGYDKNLFQFSILTGFTFFGGMSRLSDGSADFILVRVGPTGDTVWSRRSNIDSVVNGYDSLAGMAYDAQGHLCLFGTYTKSTAPESHGTAIVRYWGFDGTPSGKFLTSTSGDCYAGQIIAASNGHLHLTEKVSDGSGGFDLNLKKVNIFSGLVWTKRYGTPGTNELPADIATDMNSNSYITFTVNNASTDFATLKYNDVLTSTGNENTTAEGFSLSQNYPNPFNPVTTISYELKNTNYVKLNVYDVNGRLISSLINNVQPAGSYSVQFDGSKFSSGIYFYKLEAEGFSDTKRMVLVK